MNLHQWPPARSLSTANCFLKVQTVHRLSEAFTRLRKSACGLNNNHSQNRERIRDMNRVALAVLGTFVVILVGSALLAYSFRGRVEPGVATPSGSSASVPTQAPGELPLLGELFGPDSSGLSPSNFASWEATSARIALRFS